MTAYNPTEFRMQIGRDRYKVALQPAGHWTVCHFRDPAPGESAIFNGFEFRASLPEREDAVHFVLAQHTPSRVLVTTNREGYMVWEEDGKWDVFSTGDDGLWEYDWTYATVEEAMAVALKQAPVTLPVVQL